MDNLKGRNGLANLKEYNDLKKASIGSKYNHKGDDTEFVVAGFCGSDGILHPTFEIARDKNEGEIIRIVNSRNGMSRLEDVFFL